MGWREGTFVMRKARKRVSAKRDRIFFILENYYTIKEAPEQKLKTGRKYPIALTRNLICVIFSRLEYHYENSFAVLILILAFLHFKRQRI